MGRIMDSRKNFRLYLAILEFLFGLGVLWLFVTVNPIALKTILLMFGVAMTLWATSRWLNLLIGSLPEGHFKRLASSLGMLTGGIYYIIFGASTVWIALAWILSIIGFLSMITALQRIWVETALIGKLITAYRQAVPPNLPVPLVYIHAEPGLGVYLGQRLVAKVMKSLWEHKYLSPKSGLSVYAGSKRLDSWRGRYLWRVRQRGMMLFVVSDSVRRYSVDFRKWLASQVAAFIVLRTTLGTDESYAEYFEEEAKNGCYICPGPTFTLFIQPLGKGKVISSFDSDEVIESSWGFQDRSLESAIAPLSNRLASTALPITASDSRLSPEIRPTIQQIATEGLPMVANSYLRFRLAQSDVERFLSLLDCIESLIRSSAIVLLINQWNKANVHTTGKRLLGKPLTLGSWVYLLENLTNSTLEDGLDNEICSFWKSEVFQVQKRLINKVDETGLYSLNWKGSSQLDWLKWFTDLRNVTRGHGVVEEESLAPFWHVLHEIFLEMVSRLRFMVLSSHVVAIEPSGKEILVQGWLRGKHQYGLNQTYSEQELLASLELPSGQKVLMYPLVVVKERNVLVFDHLGTQENTIVFFDYKSGEFKQLLIPQFSDTDLYRVWMSKKAQPLP